MKNRLRHALLALALLLLFTPPVSVAAAPARAADRPRIEVCFVLDTTGSMSGLIAGAKAKIWSIANQFVSAKPTPQLKIALVAYRDRGDQYVTRVFDLSEDIDRVYADLQGFNADGGGDEPESVNQALHEAVTKVSWSADRDVLKVIFLAGDAPPHMDYRDDVKYQDTCKLAVKKDIVINTLQLGSSPATAAAWREIGDLAEGRYVAVAEDGLPVAATPMDAELAKLNAEMAGTVVAYGRAPERAAFSAKMSVAAAAPAPAAADRMAYSVAAGAAASGAVATGRGDLVEDVKRGTVALESIRKDELPPELAGKTVEEQKALLEAQSAKRKAMQARVGELVKERRDWLDAEAKKQAAAGKANSFDAQVARILKEEAARKGIRYGESAP